MKKNIFIALTLLMGFPLLWTSCTNDNNDDPDPTYTLTQADMNGSDKEVELNATGRKYGDASIPHGGSGLTTEDTYRDIYSNIGFKSSDASASGTIFTKRTYMKNADGSKGELLVTFAMAKREAGYFTDGGDWEYVMMPNDGSNDYSENPNGMLPDASATDMRGQLASCAGCHAKASNDYLFSQSETPAFEATQGDLNNSTYEEELMITGTPYGEEVSIAHGGTSDDPDSTFRDVYSNTREMEDIRVGSMLAKRTYVKNADGSKGALLVTFAMIKREAGYYDDGGDWEYVMMPNDGSNDYDANPNGMLPEVGNPMRGQLGDCAGCHKEAAGGGFSFIRGTE